MHCCKPTGRHTQTGNADIARQFLNCQNSLEHHQFRTSTTHTTQQVMSKSFDYGSSENHVEKRQELSEQLQSFLTELQKDCGTREQWPHHDRFAGEAEFWLQVHKALLGAAAELPERCTSLLLICLLYTSPSPRDRG